MLINMFQLVYCMALMAVGAVPPEQRLSKSKKQVLIEQTSFLIENGIIPMLESDDIDFEAKFSNAINYYSYYVIQLNEILGFSRTKTIKDRKTTVESYLRMLSMISKQFSSIDNKD